MSVGKSSIRRAAGKKPEEKVMPVEKEVKGAAPELANSCVCAAPKAEKKPAAKATKNAKAAPARTTKSVKSAPKATPVAEAPQKEDGKVALTQEMPYYLL